MRNPSLFKSTKSFVGKAVEFSNESLDVGITGARELNGLIKAELRSIKEINQVENANELLEAKMQGARLKAELTAEGFKQLEEIDALVIPAEVKETLKANLLQALGL